jgi:cytochrome c biogenesis protein CcmG/thiol:disulfide interchange protein DsbE
MKAFGFVPNRDGGRGRGHSDEDAGVRFRPSALSSGSHPLCKPNVRIVIKELVGEGRKLAVGLFLALVLASGCGAATEGDYGGPHPNYARALAGSPPPLAALHRQANQLLDGGADAYEARIAALRGYPIVVNVWASWCGPCRFEFPTLQKLSAAYGKRVAFLGIDKQDSNDAAKTFLSEEPVPYPSYSDPNQDIGRAIGATGGLPDTAFYDRSGNLVYLKMGPYTDHAELRADVRRYALGEGG